jgi:hypothetical protein
VRPRASRLKKIKRSRARSLSPSFTPSMAAGVTDKLWGISDIVAVLEAWEAA